jgi:hypothetical protein
MAPSQHLGFNDALLLGSLLYCCADLLCEWDSFSSCSKPIHRWLLVSYGCATGFRLVHLLGSSAAASSGAADQSRGANEFLLDLRQKGTVARLLVTFTWTLALPFFAFWTMLGTAWLWEVAAETPDCLPSTTHVWFTAFWLFLCYIWIIIHAGLGVVALVLERRVRRAEGSLREIEDDEVRQRWGEVSQISGYRSLTDPVAPGAGGGLSPADIKCLPCETLTGSESLLAVAQCECPICIMDLGPGDTVRCLPGCGHTFHRSCIDLWLLRRADCPLCKQDVSASCKQAGVWV